MSMSEAGGPTNPQEAGDAASLRPVVVAIHGIGNPVPGELVKAVQENLREGQVDAQAIGFDWNRPDLYPLPLSDIASMSGTPLCDCLSDIIVDLSFPRRRHDERVEMGTQLESISSCVPVSSLPRPVCGPCFSGHGYPTQGAANTSVLARGVLSV
jgi:hypothetical protein